ncbi:MAG: ATP-binding cassette domain-containing protein [Pseudomonadota bacterium]|nr:ATP-binding cassette domain-containing protein [Pseudomonadota bacterium]MDP1905233.1 ATP-binding cassette domain-containing protein [Pseudomonadota bacterium]MDP2352795.1 ATP-binding cassette domain-containing protein [Pseudomonadota bacterium]
MNENLSPLIDRAARLAGQRVVGGRLDELANLPEGLNATAQFITAWRVVGLDGTPAHLADPTPADLPLAAWQPEQGWFLLQGRGADGAWRGEALDGAALSLASLDNAECLSLPRRSEGAAAAPRAFGLVRQALFARKGIFIEAILATGLVNLLTLGTALYSMQIFDRVIPNQGFQTLWVLTVGVALAVSLEFLLKQVRSHMVDRTCNVIDHELSEWFFGRMLGIRMEARPASVGTLAAQVKGFEMVRGVLASTSLFVLADVPFALFFILVIFLVGGWVALVPLIALPVALGAGLIFQHLIQKHTRDNLAANNRKAGLLVEAVDGAESLKANSAEWKMQGRWNALVLEASASDQEIRTYSALAQNLTVALQQFSYIGLIATGAWLVTENLLTMGGLLACSIISNRALMPIVQLPGVMVQWAHARAAIEGLDKIIALPSEVDGAEHALVPQSLDGAIKFERVRFTYGMAKRLALEVERLEIKPGERIGMIGPIGSGKSTLLKLASGLYRPNEGKLFLSGMDMAMLTPAALREAVGYLPQEARLFSGSLRDNLLLGLPDPGDEAILEAARKSGLIDLIAGQPKGLGLEITEGGRGVSGGQKQLIALTRLLLAKPLVWLLDEPTGAMDADSEARVVALLKSVLGSQESAIVATHKTALLPLFTRLLMVQNGRIVMDGPRDEVMAKLSGKATN